MPELRLYTVAQIREWLVNNKPAEGLSEQVIAPTRAWAFIHNPYVKDGDAIVAAIFEDGQLAAYTASFPDMLDGKRVWWASTLYCYPQFAGRGYGMIVVGSLMEAHEPDLTYDRLAANETIEIFNYFGYKTTYTHRYSLSYKNIDTTTIKGKLAYGRQALQLCMHPWTKQSKADYSLRYASYIDGEAYAFMKSHRGNDLWLRERDMHNWLLRYPFGQSCLLQNRVVKDTEFSANNSCYAYRVVKVYRDNALIGVYVLRQKNEDFAVLYLYFDEGNRDLVYTSIVDHVIGIKPHAFITDKRDLSEFVRQRLYFPKYEAENVSISLPVFIDCPNAITLQLGDGDSFV